ncbi:MAG: hypothetical protein IJV06_06345 [Bacteroidaceae bacterium]|nr:hypothetical protein [Bacteroidaceae bacterium]
MFLMFRYRVGFSSLRCRQSFADNCLREPATLLARLRSIARVSALPVEWGAQLAVLRDIRCKVTAFPRNGQVPVPRCVKNDDKCVKISFA